MGPSTGGYPLAVPTTAKTRLTQVGLLAVIAVLSWCVAMCSPSNGASPTGHAAKAEKPAVSAVPPSSAPSAAAPPAPPPPVAKDYVEGLVESVAGGTIQLRTRTGSATVDFTPATRVVEVTPARLSDVTPGSCVNVRATPQSAPTGAGGSVTAQSVTITPAVDGKCPPPAGFYGTVASVSGNTITISGTDAHGKSAPTNVTVTQSTSYGKQALTDDQAIAHGRCLGAQGTNGDGALQAMSISLETCPPMGRPHHHHLHFPFHL